jgi:hypothetical protein
MKLPNEWPSTQSYSFNFHKEDLNVYKYSNWIFHGEFMVRVYDFKIRWEKTSYEVDLKIEKIDGNLREWMEEMVRLRKRLSKLEVLILLYRIHSIYEFMISHSITHRNFSLSRLCFTGTKQLKIHGWSEPSRNWHISDFKDYLLVCFNVITHNCYDKLSDKIILKHENELRMYPVFGEKIQQGFRQNKMIEKKT